VTSTTSLKLPDALKATIAQVAASEGKSAHALMVETLQSAMDDALERQRFHADGEAAYQETLRTGTVYRANDVKTYITARVGGGQPARPQAQTLDPAKPGADA
jgi:predicted transcriptional regulator